MRIPGTERKKPLEKSESSKISSFLMKNPFIIAKYNVFRSISIILVSFMNRFLVAQTHRQRGGRTHLDAVDVTRGGALGVGGETREA